MRELACKVNPYGLEGGSMSRHNIVRRYCLQPDSTTDADEGIELNLRLPAMLHGKKGFERVVTAAKSVLNNSLVWLFADLSKQESDGGMFLELIFHVVPSCDG